MSVKTWWDQRWPSETLTREILRNIETRGGSENTPCQLSYLKCLLIQQRVESVIIFLNPGGQYIKVTKTLETSK